MDGANEAGDTGCFPALQMALRLAYETRHRRSAVAPAQGEAVPSAGEPCFPWLQEKSR